jgi:hypothetical protein
MGSENAAKPIFSFATPEWLKSFNGGPQTLDAAVSKEALGFTASCLEEQAEHLKRLAECANPAEALRCQLDFAQQFWSRSVGEASRAFDRLRTHS